MADCVRSLLPYGTGICHYAFIDNVLFLSVALLKKYFPLSGVGKLAGEVDSTSRS